MPEALNEQQLDVLDSLVRLGPSLVEALARDTGRSPNGIALSLAALERRQLVRLAAGSWEATPQGARVARPAPVGELGQLEARQALDRILAAADAPVHMPIGERIAWALGKLAAISGAR